MSNPVSNPVSSDEQAVSKAEAPAPALQDDPTALALAPLLAPLAGDDPCGELLRYDPLYDEIKELRRHDDPSLPQGVWKHELKRGDFRAVATACEGALTARTKDLQLAVWLTEAWTHTEELVGFERGLRLLDGLCERFWDGLHPRLEEDGAEFRLAPLHWLADNLPAAIKQIPFTAPTTEEQLRFSWSDQLSALRTANLTRGDAKIGEQADKAGKPTLDKIRLGLTLTPTAFLRELATRLARSRSALDRLDARLTEHCGSNAPSFAPLRDLLREMQSLADKTLAERAEDPVAEPAADLEEIQPMADSQSKLDGASPEAAATPLGARTTSPAGTAAASGPITSRSEAYRRLEEAAEFLLRTEPHSPTPYLVKRAVAWGGLTLGELLAELLASGTDLKTVYQLLGIGRAG